ncbi:MAG: thiamine biosynthesis lipoprotein [Limimaricola cinnabarinus]|jgi:thiamine biosynthesis lipoprotein|uniref:FAD:protein FMN transferase n=1 Tax=Limimaricola cinnabarinus TaxID=1125964 RepID=UPI0039E56CBC
MPSRRRFLAIAAAAIAAPGAGHAATWRGTALGATAAITLLGPRHRVEPALAAARETLERMEALFSLYREDSALSRLNATGRIEAPDADFTNLMALCDRAVAATGGRFDPTVQPLWRALAEGGDARDAAARIGWGRVTTAPGIRLGRGQALTLNGIAQGFASDRVAEGLAAVGFSRALVDIGEMRALGGPWRIGIEDHAQGLMGQVSLSGGAIATSSPDALLLPGDASHILDPLSGSLAQPLWSSVSVEADTAALADALSTAMCLMPREEIEGLRVEGLRKVRLVDRAGDMVTL